MTMILEWPREIEEQLRRRAQERGVRVEEYLWQLAERDAPVVESEKNDEITPEIAARLAALDKLDEVIRAMPNHRAGLPELDLSGARADVYGYTEREDAQL